MFFFWKMFLHEQLTCFLKLILDCREIFKHGDLYLRRFYLFHTERVSAFLHYLRRGDRDRDLHDHPWDWWAVLLTGTYVEEIPVDLDTYTTAGDRRTKLVRRWPMIPRFMKAEQLHRLHLHKPVWTLFIHFKRRRTWGFQTVKGWCPHYMYLDVSTGDKDSRRNSM